MAGGHRVDETILDRLSAIVGANSCLYLLQISLLYLQCVKYHMFVQCSVAHAQRRQVPVNRFYERSFNMSTVVSNEIRRTLNRLMR